MNVILVAHPDEVPFFPGWGAARHPSSESRRRPRGDRNHAGSATVGRRARLRAVLAIATVLGAAVLSASVLQAQNAAAGEEIQPSRLYAGVSMQAAQPQGEFADYVNTGFGGNLHLILRLDEAGLLGLRLDGGLVNYGRETRRVPLSSTIGGRVNVDVSTNNNIAFLGVGPQLMAPNGTLRPYANGTVGLAYFFTQSSVRGTHQSGDFANTENYRDAVLTYGGSAGLYIPVRRGPQPISIDLGARYYRNGRADYLREGDIHDNADGTITLTPTRSEADLIGFYLGASVGLPMPKRDGTR